MGVGAVVVVVGGGVALALVGAVVVVFWLVFVVVVVFWFAGGVPVLGVVAVAVALKLGPYDIIHPYNNYGVKHALFFGGFVAFSELWTLFLRSR